MKKYASRAFNAIACATLALMLPLETSAQNPLPSSPIESSEDIIRLAEKIVKWTYQLFFIAATFYVLLAAFTYLRAKDNAKEVEKATASLKNAAIAIVVALIATGAAAIIKSVLG